MEQTQILKHYQILFFILINKFECFGLYKNIMQSILVSAAKNQCVFMNNQFEDFFRTL
jgi:hypothetical protein